MLSINLINYNNGEASEKFVESFKEFTDLLNMEYEVILVDNYSDDGSYETLVPITDIVIRKNCDRGEARNLALEHGSGKVTLDQLDTDQTPQPELAQIINWYHNEMPYYCINTNGCMINNREIVEKFGFGDYQSGEDKYLWDRLIEDGSYKFLQVNTAKHIIHNHERSPPFYDAFFDYPTAHREMTDHELQEKILN